MGQYLRDISIHTSNIQILPSGKSLQDFNGSTHNVQDIFFYQIPKKFEFDKISKLNILITDKVQENQRLTRMIDGVVVYNYSGFDFENYFTLPSREQNLEILRILRMTIEDIGKNTTDKGEVLLKIIDSIPKNNFELVQENKKLSKGTRDKKYSSSVSLVVNGEGQNVFVDILDKDENKIIHDHLLTSLDQEFWIDHFSSKWDGHTFKILYRDGHLVKQYEVKV
jgi:hypothetical protein